ncbi:MAG: hypothetical protein WCD18_16360 [Thermosynechococcaceae cyanobacterium]
MILVFYTGRVFDVREVFLALFGAASIIGGAIAVSYAQNREYKAQGCAQMFGAKGTTTTKYGEMSAEMTSPTSPITNAWAAGPNGLTTLSQGGIPHYIEAGPTRDCFKGLSCSTTHPYSSFSDKSGLNSDETVDRKTRFDNVVDYHRFNVRYVGNKR